MTTLKVKDYTEFPGPRFREIGPYSGQDFLETYLLPLAKEHGASLIVDLDDTAGYGSSFLEEAFGGLVRKGIPKDVAIAIGENLISEEDPTLLGEIRAYIEDSINELSSK
ncbi:STAS-like domain-containing protein [uncultured Zhongshania sp.]|jgi:hypothetical protein|uniref:STAS-like domain-containing protein n=1 Tax=uncultured Zhongshania sp. TaxID=1642288 RepID=UPI0025CD1691|nr:STAS-like domain-containing protein [uncultured Zhongshania sp.]